MLPKTVHVIIIGLSEEERAALDRSTLRMLRFVDPAWEYSSSGAQTLEEAVRLAMGMEKAEILFVARESPTPDSAAAALARARQLMQKLAGHPSNPVLSYNSRSYDNKLALAIFALWRDRNRAAK